MTDALSPSLSEMDPAEIAEVVHFGYRDWLEHLPDRAVIEDCYDYDLGPAHVLSITYQDFADVRVAMPKFPDEDEEDPVSDQTEIFKIERVNGRGPKWKYLEKGEGPPETWFQGDARQRVVVAAEVALDALAKGEVVLM